MEILMYNPLFLGGRERPPEHRNGQVLFSPHDEFKTKGGEESRSSFVPEAVIYM
ncbi:hypothetical protein [Bacillus pseudomycoides]|uniref:hypothetical protein n=1 Tax=Bacillus pseudomycoides TaxID=64104 RepID=UPI00159BECB5|nr:hypothetical protein [Bacillus pseudomycoides]